MDYQQGRYRLFSGLAAVMLIFAGCAPQIQKPVKICPGKENAGESLSLLRSRSKNATSLKAGGQCFLRYHIEENKFKKENFPVKLWVNPPAEIYMQGDVAFNPKGISIGSNEQEFWLAMKPKEISSYWWGQWTEGKYPGRLMINPRLMLEAFGVIEAEDIENWFLSNEGAFDILTKRQGSTKTKKVYINNCDYLVRRVEYFGDDGQVSIAMELDKYKEPVSGFFVPGFIKIINYHNGEGRDSAQISLGSVKPASFTDKQRKYLFVRPQPEGFEHIYRITESGIIEQTQ